MKKTPEKMSLWIVLPIVVLMAAAFAFMLARLVVNNAALGRELVQVKKEASDAQLRQPQLEKQLSQTSDKLYIGKIARTKYGFMSQEEKKIVILNPYVLYENDGGSEINP